ncbi:MAG: hypothetical protein ACO1TE_11825 [Prosthecobacter sp.]
MMPAPFKAKQMAAPLLSVLLSLTLVQPLLGDPAQVVDNILQEAQKTARKTALGWKKVAIQTAATLDAHEANVVTNALYARLKADGPDGAMRAMVSRIACTTKSFSPDAWLAKLPAEQDPFILVAGTQIFGLTEFKGDPRFQDLLHSFLKDTRVGRRLVGEEGAYSDNGARVCDAVYNILMSGQKDRPPEFPLDVAGDTVETRDRLITQLCVKLGVPGPTSSDTSKPASPAKEAPAASGMN